MRFDKVCRAANSRRPSMYNLAYKVNFDIIPSWGGTVALIHIEIGKLVEKISVGGAPKTFRAIIWAAFWAVFLGALSSIGGMIVWNWSGSTLQQTVKPVAPASAMPPTAVEGSVKPAPSSSSSSPLPSEKTIPAFLPNTPLQAVPQTQSTPRAPPIRPQAPGVPNDVITSDIDRTSISPAAFEN